MTIEQLNNLQSGMSELRAKSELENLIEQTVYKYQRHGFTNIRMYEEDGEYFLTANRPPPDPESPESRRSRSLVHPSQNNGAGQPITFYLSHISSVMDDFRERTRRSFESASHSHQPSTPAHSRTASPSNAHAQSVWASPSNVQRELTAFQPGTHDHEASTSYHPPNPPTYGHEASTSYQSHGAITPTPTSFRSSRSTSPYLPSTPIARSQIASPSLTRTQSSVSHQSPVAHSLHQPPTAQEPASHPSGSTSVASSRSRLGTFLSRRSNTNNQQGINLISFFDTYQIILICCPLFSSPLHFFRSSIFVGCQFIMAVAKQRMTVAKQP